MAPASPPAARILDPFQRFARTEAASGIVLLACAAVALTWANTPWSGTYFELWHTELAVEIGGFRLAHSLHWWINDGLMVPFFFLVGLEIKREILVGELATLRKAAFPIAAAAGGMLVPAAVYAVLNPGGIEARGWAIPMATDIAFALGVLALVGSRVPVGLKVFLAALAIVDDIGAVIVISAIYSEGIAWHALGAGVLVLLGMMTANRIGVRSPVPYAMLGIGLWLAFLFSGVHPTVAGVLSAFAIPARTRLDREEFLEESRRAVERFEMARTASDGPLITGPQIEAIHALESAAERVQTPLQRLEHALAPWVLFLIVPLFALANAGVVIAGGAPLNDPVLIGVFLGLVVGKQAGITLGAWLSVRLGLASLPPGVTWSHVYGVACLAGIGFTMSLFITALAFPEGDLSTAAKTGILAGSAASGWLGWVLLRRCTKP